MHNIADSLERTAGEGELLREQPKRRTDPDADFVFPELELSCEAVIELERDRVRRIKASNEAMQSMMPYTRAQMAKPTFNELFDSILGHADSIKQLER